MKSAIVSKRGHNPHIAMAIHKSICSSGIKLSIRKPISIRLYRGSKIRLATAIRIAPIHQILGIPHHRGKTPSQILLLLHIAAKNPKHPIFIRNTRIMNGIDVARFSRNMRATVTISLICGADLLEVGTIV